MDAQGHGSVTVVGGGIGELVVMWGGFPLLGAGLGAALTAGSGWLADLAWVPFQGWFALLSGLPEAQAYAGGTGVPALAGLLVAYVGTRERLTVTVGRTGVRLHRDGHGRDVDRAGVDAVFLDGKALVLLDADGAELAREKSDLTRDRLRAAFTGHGWPWVEQDPHREAYRRWVAGLPGLPPGGDALLRARQRALDADRGGEARELRAELARLGVVVRDEGRRQYWRPVEVPLHREQTPDER
ncbi:YqeB family protein [Micromonospora citrea]|uniref:YqeB family protein n=1 Tax=Micromonospora citrea TaxID=47855 RepID=UPI003C6346A9